MLHTNAEDRKEPLWWSRLSEPGSSGPLLLAQGGPEPAPGQTCL